MALHQPLIDRVDGRHRPLERDSSIAVLPTVVAAHAERVQVAHVSLWSVVRSAAVFWVAAAAAVFGFLALAWGVASATGLLGTLESLAADMLGADEVSIRGAHVLGAAAFLAALFAGLATIVTTVAAAIYNLGAHVMGGIELDLDER